jgi:hypothetical protein
LLGGAATLLSSHARTSRSATSDTAKASQADTADSVKSESARRRSGPSPQHRTSPTAAIRTASVIPALGCRHRLRALGSAAFAVRPRLEPRGQHQQVRRDALSGFRTSFRTSRTFVARCRSKPAKRIEESKVPVCRHFVRWRDPDSNRGHHDFRESSAAGASPRSACNWGVLVEPPCCSHCCGSGAFGVGLGLRRPPKSETHWARNSFSPRRDR